MSKVLAFLDTLTDEQLETLTDEEIIQMMKEQEEQ
jgi:hypothetical protein